VRPRAKLLARADCRPPPRSSRTYRAGCSVRACAPSAFGVGTRAPTWPDSQRPLTRGQSKSAPRVRSNFARWESRLRDRVRFRLVCRFRLPRISGSGGESGRELDRDVEPRGRAGESDRRLFPQRGVEPTHRSRRVVSPPQGGERHRSRTCRGSSCSTDSQQLYDECAGIPEKITPTRGAVNQLLPVLAIPGGSDRARFIYPDQCRRKSP